PRRIERGLAGGGIERSLPRRRQRLALVLDPAPTQRDRFGIEGVRERRGQRGQGGNAAPRDGNVAGKAADRIARKPGIESALDDLAVPAGRGSAWNPGDGASSPPETSRPLHQVPGVRAEASRV